MIAEAYLFLCWVKSSQLQTSITFRFPILLIAPENLSIKALRIVLPELRQIDSSMPFQPGEFKAELQSFLTVWANENAPHSRDAQECLTHLGDIPLLVTDHALFTEIKNSFTEEEWERGELKVTALGTPSGTARIIVNPEMWLNYDMIKFQTGKWLVIK